MIERAPLVESQDAVALVKIVTHRLFKAVGILLLVVLVVSAVAASPWEMPGGVAILVIATGALGGFISIQRRLKELTLGDLQLFADSLLYTLLSPLVGGVLALLLYLIFVSGLVQGDLFPTFIPDTVAAGEADPQGLSLLYAHHADEYASYAKLLFWSFVAGFSEHFVTDIIGHFESASTRPTIDS